MNEALLIILILITGITFFNLIKKVGIATPGAVSALQQNGTFNYPENFGNVLYSSGNSNIDNGYNNLWSVTATSDSSNNPVFNKITVVYHQCKKVKNIIKYAANNEQFNSDAAFVPTDVCVSSNISDIQYRHVLLEEK